jgi:hypothetical protein
MYISLYMGTLSPNEVVFDLVIMNNNSHNIDLQNSISVNTRCHYNIT